MQCIIRISIASKFQFNLRIISVDIHPWQLYNMYSRMHIPPYYRCTMFENFLPIICRDIPHFVNFSLVYVRL